MKRFLPLVYFLIFCIIFFISLAFWLVGVPLGAIWVLDQVLVPPIPFTPISYLSTLLVELIVLGAIAKHNS